MNFFKRKKVLYYLLFLLLVIDLGYSFWQHQAKSLDGDMAWNALPAADVKTVLDNPLGFKAIAQDTNYVNPNRFFCHWFNQQYILKAPLFFQNWFSPIDSVYISMGLARTITQLFLLVLLGMFINKSYKFWKFNGLLAMFIVAGFFQTNGFNKQIGMIDESSTYVFFYATSFVFLLIYLFPFVHQVFFKKSSSIPFIVKIFWPFLALVVSLSGPLNTGVALIFILLVIVHQFRKLYRKNPQFISKPWMIFKKLPVAIYFYLLPLGVFSLYSLYLGKYNSLTIESELPLLELYGKMIEGVIPIFFSNEGFFILFLIILVNYFLIKRGRYKSTILLTINWLLIFCLLYVLLLPFGGYRDYRPYLIRNDTLLPVIYSLVFMVGSSSLFLLLNMKAKKGVYIMFVLGFVFFFTKLDNEGFNNNECEKRALIHASKTNQKVMELNTDCAPIGWELFRFPEESTLQSKLMKHWNITEKEVLFWNKDSKE